MTEGGSRGIANEGTLAQRLAGFALSIEAKSVPPEILDKLQAVLLYGLTVALAEYDVADEVQLAMAETHTAPGRATLFGSSATRSAADAAAINAARMFARNQVDTHADCCGHLGCVVMPAVFALAEERQADLGRVVAALIAGLETPPKVGRSVMASAVARGFRGTSVFGVFGAAVGAGVVIGLDESKLAHAISIAASYASGVTQCFADGTQEGALQIAQACRGGVMAALLAEQGVRGAPNALEGPAGFYRAFSDTTPSLDLRGWSLPQVTFKPTPGCVINQQVIGVLLKLRAQLRRSPDSVSAVRVALHPEDAAYPGIGEYGPFVTRQGACMSTAFMAETALEAGRLTFQDFSRRHGPDPLHDRSRRVRVVADSSLVEKFTCRVFLDLDDGTSLAAEATSSTALAYDLQQTVDLCRSIATEWPASLGPKALDTLIDRVADVAACRRPEAVGALMQTLRG